jgi:SAM-dependent methyltransferase
MTAPLRPPAAPAGEPDFLDVTEITGSPISAEQVERLVNRYRWAAHYCRGKDVVEAGCGVGPGLGLLAVTARSLEAGDCSAPILDLARGHYGRRISLTRFDAENLPFADASKDVIILFEALYYLRQPRRFVSECCRVLRADGKVLISTANKDLWEFHPSPHVHEYHGVLELRALFEPAGFTCEFFGLQRADRSPLRQRLLRPVKRAAVVVGLMPTTMKGKRWLKRIVFGAEVPMPAELPSEDASYVPPERIPGDAADRRHKVVYCAATRTH